jgi:hypothetical protein
VKRVDWRPWISLAIFSVVGFLLFLLTACTQAQIHDNAPGFFTGLAAAVSAIPGIGPVLAPMVISLGGVVTAASGVAGAGALAGAATVHHLNFGLPGTGRRKKLAAARAAHAAAKAQAA